MFHSGFTVANGQHLLTIILEAPCSQRSYLLTNESRHAPSVITTADAVILIRLYVWTDTWCVLWAKQNISIILSGLPFQVVSLLGPVALGRHLLPAKNSPNHDTFTLKMATTVFAETLNKTTFDTAYSRKRKIWCHLYTQWRRSNDMV